MIRIKLHVAVLIAIPLLTIFALPRLRALTAPLTAPLTTSDKPNGSAPRTPVLIELFTSEGCSSCPPADALLEKLDRSQPVPAAEMIVLSEHVDYWNDIGWKDPYSSRQFSIRQGDYAHRFQLEGPYTPQMVVDGDAQIVGSDERQALHVTALHANESAAKLAKLPVALSAPHLQGADTLVVHVDVGSPLPPAKLKSAQVWIALADDSDQSSVKRGENAGRILRHVAVVRTLTQVGTVEANNAFSKDVTVSTANTTLQNLRVVAFVQEGVAGRVLGVASTRLAN
jgi:hypothetical protein